MQPPESTEEKSTDGNGHCTQDAPIPMLVLPVCVREPRCCRVHDERARNACLHVDSCCFPFGVPDEMRARSTRRLSVCRSENV
jgi:hypothetical protein